MKQRMKNPIRRRMKKKRNNCIACAVIAALLCLLCACGGPASPGPDGQAPNGQGTDGGNAFSSEAPGLTAGTAGSGGDLIPLSRGTDKGCYTMGEKDGNLLLCYVDYDLAMETPLCAQPSCSHDSDACTAFVEPEKSAWNPRTGDGSAIFFQMIDRETGSGEIWTADPDGSNRRILEPVSSGAGVPSLAAEDGVFLYYFYTFEPEENGQAPGSEVRLARVPITGGESEELFAWEDYGTGANYQFLGVSGREIAINRYDWGDPMDMFIEVPDDTPPEEREAIIDAQLEQQKQITGHHSVLLVNVDTGVQRELAVWTSNLGSAGRSLLWENGRLYWCDDKTCGPIHWQDVDGQSGELSAMPEKINDEDPVYTLCRVVQGKLLADCYGFKADTCSRWAIDLSGDPADGNPAGSAEALTLRYVHNVSERPVRIEAQGEAGLLVQYEETAEYSTGFYEDDGTPRTNLSVTSRYGMISYEDYFANRPNYRPVEMPYGFRPE